MMLPHFVALNKKTGASFGRGCCVNLNKQANKKYIEGFLCAFAYLSFPSSEAFWDSTKNNTNGTKWDEGSAVGPTPFFLSFCLLQYWN